MAVVPADPELGALGVFDHGQDLPSALGHVDLLRLDGDPIANVRILQEKDRLLAIMKDGKFHKKPQMQEARRRLTA